jgi:hypothetical protein
MIKLLIKPIREKPPQKKLLEIATIDAYSRILMAVRSTYIRLLQNLNK